MRVVAALLLLLATVSAQATIVTVDPSSYASGTNISNAFDGVSLSTIWLDSSRLGTETGRIEDAPFHYESVFAATCVACGGITGTTVFGNTAPTVLNRGGALTPVFSFSSASAHFLGDGSLAGSFFATEYWSALFIEFDQATDFVQMVGGGKPANPFYFDLWSADGTRIARCWTNEDGPLDPGCAGFSSGPTNDIKYPWTLSFQSTDANIRYVTAGGIGGDQYIESLAFSSVPEPSLLSVMGLAGGLLLVSRVRRKRMALPAGFEPALRP